MIISGMGDDFDHDDHDDHDLQWISEKQRSGDAYFGGDCHRLPSG